MADLLGDAPARRQFSQPPTRAEKLSPRMTRAEIVARFGVADLKSPRAHKCFRCGVSTGLAFGSLLRGGKIVFARQAHFEELM